MKYRNATASDIDAIAAVHADSWRRTYRGAYSDAFLDGDVFEERLGEWTRRLTHPRLAYSTIVAEDDDGRVVGFACTILDHDPTWGALLDNLHVTHDFQRTGIGRRLMAESVTAVLEHTPSSGLYLWVLEQNTGAQAFYDALGGQCVGREPVAPPGGDPSRLRGDPVALRYAWPEPFDLRNLT